MGLGRAEEVRKASQRRAGCPTLTSRETWGISFESASTVDAVSLSLLLTAATWSETPETALDDSSLTQASWSCKYCLAAACARLDSAERAAGQIHGTGKPLLSLKKIGRELAFGSRGSALHCAKSGP